MRIEEKYHDPILAIIKEKGALGVNQIANEIGMAVSSVQKYLNRQDYFKQGTNKKWDLPENVNATIEQTLESNRLALLAASLKTQGLLVGNSLELFVTGVTDLLKHVDNIAPALESYKPSVANDKSIDPRLNEYQEKLKDYPKVIKQHMKEIPEFYHSLLSGLDWVEMALDLGRIQINEIGKEIVELITKNRDVLEDDTVNTLERYQK